MDNYIVFQDKETDYHITNDFLYSLIEENMNNKNGDINIIKDHYPSIRFNPIFLCVFPDYTTPMFLYIGEDPNNKDEKIFYQIIGINSVLADNAKNMEDNDIIESDKIKKAHHNKIITAFDKSSIFPLYILATKLVTSDKEKDYYNVHKSKKNVNKHIDKINQYVAEMDFCGLVNYLSANVDEKHFMLDSYFAEMELPRLFWYAPMNFEIPIIYTHKKTFYPKGDILYAFEMDIEEMKKYGELK